MPRDELIDLEEQGWRALSTGGEVAAEFYDRVFDRAVVMLLPRTDARRPEYDH